jgi:hypothetical protein
MFASCSLSATINKFSPLIDDAGKREDQTLRKSPGGVHH